MFHILHARIKNTARWESSTIKMLGAIEIILGLVLMIPILMAWFYGEDPMLFVYPIPILLSFGTFQYIFFKSSQTINPASGMMMMFIAWGVAFLVSSVPFYLYGFSSVDSLFEGVSGLTTTGASVVDNLDLPYSLLFWKSFIQWAGGIAVVLIFLFLIPMMGVGGKSFVNSELVGSDTHNFSLRIRNAAKNFISIYIFLSITELMLLIISGVESFEAMTLMLSTISTGGSMASGDNMSDFSFAAQFIVLAFMLLGGTNFYLHYRAINKREFSAYKKSQEFVWTIMWFLAAAAAIIFILILATNDLSTAGLSNSIWNTLFTVVSMGTTTGFIITDRSFWPMAAYVVMWMVMLFGSMSGSTSGGIKIYRLLILKSYITNGIYKMFHPRSVRDVSMDGHSVSNDAVVSAMVVIMMFMAVLVVSVVALLIMSPGISISESIGLSISAISNVGIPTGNISFGDLSDASKIFLSFIMWIGRLEVVIALLLFTKTFWRDLSSDLKSGRQGAGNRKH